MSNIKEEMRKDAEAVVEWVICTDGSLFIGDSRCNGLLNGMRSISGMSAKYPAKSDEARGGDGEDANGCMWFCEHSKKLEWIKANQKHIDEMATKSGTDNIIFVMGGNDPNASKYIKYFNELVEREEYKNKNIFFVGIPPRKNKNATTVAKGLNNKLAQGLPENVTFIDLFACFEANPSLKDHYAKDGTHFDTAANAFMYKWVMNEITSVTMQKQSEEAKEKANANSEELKRNDEEIERMPVIPVIENIFD